MMSPAQHAIHARSLRSFTRPSFLSNFFAQTEALDAQDQSTRALIEYYRANRTK
ncbi:hypothetical protein [Actinomyces sp.]